MKAKLSLPERPSALFLVAVVDLLVALLVFTTLLPAIGQQAGVMLDPLEFRIPKEDRAEITIKDGPPPVFYISGMRISRDALQADLERRRDEDKIEWVIIIADAKVESQVTFDVVDLVDAAGLESVLVGLQRDDSE